MSLPSHTSLSAVLYRTPPPVVERLLESCRTAEGLELAVCIVDNSPDDELRELVTRHGFEYVHRPDNPGYGASHNLAFAKVGATSRYHFILNPDVAFQPYALAALVDHMDQYPDIGLLMPMIRYPDGRMQQLCKLLPTPIHLIMRRFFGGFASVRKADFRYELQFSGYEQEMEVPYLSGCFMLARSELFRQIRGFDERFFMYFEDLDITRRIGQHARTVYFPSVSIVHEYSKGSYRLNRLLLVHLVSAFRYFNKWGWVFDRERKTINRKTLESLGWNRERAHEAGVAGRDRG